MGIDANLLYHIAGTVSSFEVRGSLCSLGVPALPAEDRIERVLAPRGITTPRDLPVYARLGFDRVETLDVSDFEGCTQIFDLNNAGVPAHLYGQFDAVYNGGTLEHVFDTRNALRNVFELLKVGGVVIHAGPANGWLEHGFYQFSPTLLVDYYVANRFDILEACIIHSPSGDTATAMVYPYVPGAFDHAVPKLTGRSLFYMTFRKQCTSTWEAIPQQRYYREIYGNDTEQDAPHLRYAPPYLLQDGVRLDDERSLHALPAPVRSNGFEWMVHLPEIAHASDGIDRQSSRLMLFEDGVPIGPPHALHAAIQTMGRGRYSHWGERLRFSSSRNDDARAHEYAYALSAHQL